MNAEIDVSGVTLHTPRLILRPWRQSDLEDFYAYASDPEVGPMAGWTPHRSCEDSQQILDRFIAHKKTFALEFQGRVVGSIGVERYDEDNAPELAALRCRELGFVLAKDCWGRGLMPEAVEEVLRYLFEEVRLDAVLCGHFLRNRQSLRVQEKCGFRHHSYGICKTKAGTAEDHELRILTRAEWLDRRSKPETPNLNTEEKSL